MGMAATGPLTSPPWGGGHNGSRRVCSHRAPNPAQGPPPGAPQSLPIFAFLPGKTPPPQGNASCFSVAHPLLGPLLRAAHPKQ